jgi:hypothetical protein
MNEKPPFWLDVACYGVPALILVVLLWLLFLTVNLIDQKPYRALKKGPTLKPWQFALAFPVLVAPVGLMWNWYMDDLSDPGRALAMSAIIGFVCSLPFIIKARGDCRNQPR